MVVMPKNFGYCTFVSPRRKHFVQIQILSQSRHLPCKVRSSSQKVYNKQQKPIISAPFFAQRGSNQSKPRSKKARSAVVIITTSKKLSKVITIKLENQAATAAKKLVKLQSSGNRPPILLYYISSHMVPTYAA